MWLADGECAWQRWSCLCSHTHTSMGKNTQQVTGISTVGSHQAVLIDASLASCFVLVIPCSQPVAPVLPGSLHPWSVGGNAVARRTARGRGWLPKWRVAGSAQLQGEGKMNLSLRLPEPPVPHGTAAASPATACCPVLCQRGCGTLGYLKLSLYGYIFSRKSIPFPASVLLCKERRTGPFTPLLYLYSCP